MSVAHFIARRIHFNSKPAVRIATIGIALGLAVMLVAIAVVTGFKNEVSQKVFGFGSHIQITALTNNQTYELPPIVMPDSTLHCFLQVPNVQKAERYAVKPAIVKTHEHFKGVVLKGVDYTFDWSFFKQHLIEGQLPALSDSTLSNQVLVSATIANSLNLHVGDKLLTYFIQNNIRVRSFVVSGIYDTGLGEFDKLFMLGDLQHIQRLNGWSDQQVSGVQIGVKELDLLEETGYQLFQLTAHTFGEGYDNPYYTRTALELQPQIFSWLALLDINMVVILVLMMAVAGFTMISGLLILILEKTALIGTLKALGASNWTIRKVFLFQSAYLIGKGMLWGNAIGLLVYTVQAQYKLLTLDPSIYFVDTVPVELTWGAWLLLNVGVAVLTLSMMLLPSHIIAKISPAKAIKFD